MSKFSCLYMLNFQSPISIFLHELQCFQSLKAFSSNICWTMAEMGWSCAIVFAPSIDLCQALHTNGITKIEVSCNWCWIVKTYFIQHDPCKTTLIRKINLVLFDSNYYDIWNNIQCQLSRIPQRRPKLCREDQNGNCMHVSNHWFIIPLS